MAENKPFSATFSRLQVGGFTSGTPIPFLEADVSQRELINWVPAWITGGLLAATAHVLGRCGACRSAAHYERLSQPIDLLLFAGGVKVLLG